MSGLIEEEGMWMQMCAWEGNLLARISDLLSLHCISKFFKFRFLFLHHFILFSIFLLIVSFRNDVSVKVIGSHR